ncbi:hypothetical protein BV898_07369 [Hypsibius exemplaris]|uniref:Uncharacterized protein n=1 Tax=Hypsibius exemplaris TaxID=2072580 RepID=A0A1W0WTK9_HYPEX|nr:hypothetical protein BV898_07369 [Hypsibius exemplaris]
MRSAIALLVLCLVAFVACRDRSRTRSPASSLERGRHNADDFSDIRGGRNNFPDPNGNYLRIKVEIIKLTNDKGLKSNGGVCDTFGTCDPVCYANLDTERPNADWPGAKPDTTWPTIYGVDDVNSPSIGVTIKKDICGPVYHEANLRIYCLDRDPATKDDLINQWDCPINRIPAANEGGAEWSPSFNCLAKFQADKMSLSYRYQIYHITRLQCNSTLTP